MNWRCPSVVSTKRVDAGKIAFGLQLPGGGRAIGQTETAGLPVSSHLFPEISAQLLAVSPQAHWLEYQDWAASILQRSLEVKDGFAISHNEPGCGNRVRRKCCSALSASLDN
jgi:L-alanine-DL-glutamate epimerase-like enolase superfamily enzyme